MTNKREYQNGVAYDVGRPHMPLIKERETHEVHGMTLWSAFDKLLTMWRSLANTTKTTVDRLATYKDDNYFMRGRSEYEAVQL